MRTAFSISFVLILSAISSLIHAASLPDNLKWQTNLDAPTWADPAASKGGTFNDFMLVFPPTLRNVGPDSNSSFRSYINANNMGLTSFHPNTLEIIPEMATEWAYGDDGKTVYYKIDPAARWSDGEPVTADDFLYTLEFMRSKHINAPWYNNHYTEQFTDVTKYDDHTISITGATARPKDELHYYYGLGPTPKHFYGKLDKDWVKNHNWKVVPNTGPYQISKVKKGKYIDFKRKEDWWAKDKRYNVGRFNADKVRIKVIRDANIAYKHFEKGELDSFGLVQPDFWHNKAKGKIYDKGLVQKAVFYNDMPRSSSGFFLNTAHPLLKDKPVRTALAHALNFDRVIATVLRNDFERLEAFHTGYGEYTNKNIKAREYDLKKAGDILDKAGWTARGGDGIRTKDGQRLSLELVYGRKEHNDRWSVLKQDAIKAGIELKLKLQDPSAHYKTIMQKQHQIAALGWSTGFRPAFWQHFHSENANKPQTNNITNTAVPEIDELIMSYRNETSIEKRISLAQSLAQHIHDNAAFIPSFKVTYTRGAHWRWLKFPEVPGTKTTGSLYSPFGNGGLFWIDNKTKVDTMRARKSKAKFPVVLKTYDKYRSNPS